MARKSSISIISPAAGSAGVSQRGGSAELGEFILGYVGDASDIQTWMGFGELTTLDVIVRLQLQSK